MNIDLTAAITGGISGGIVGFLSSFILYKVQRRDSKNDEKDKEKEENKLIIEEFLSDMLHNRSENSRIINQLSSISETLKRSPKGPLIKVTLNFRLETIKQFNNRKVLEEKFNSSELKKLDSVFQNINDKLEFFYAAASRSIEKGGYAPGNGNYDHLFSTLYDNVITSINICSKALAPFLPSQ